MFYFLCSVVIIALLSNRNNVKRENKRLTRSLNVLQEKFVEFGYHDCVKIQELVEKYKKESNALCRSIENDTNKLNTLEKELQNKEKQLRTTINKISKNKEIIKAIDYAITNFNTNATDINSFTIVNCDLSYIEELLPSVILKLNAMNIADLRKANNENNKVIQKVLDQYKDRYTTKTNKTIYSLMVIALRAELQNVLVNLKYEKLDKAVEEVKEITKKYLTIAGDGNQSIMPTLTKFIGEIEYLFINAVKIEYNYYVKKEQAKQEQLAIRAQMRQEAEERKALQLEREKIEKEEEKFSLEMNKIKEQIQNNENDAEIKLLKARLLELEAQLADVTIKKDEIISLQNGKAGTVYVISNLGSFGENVFKVGMTRRLEPMDRVKELGDASVPFGFDVHSFIFSDDAVGLETNLHRILNDRRVNKVNRRKEFFNLSIDELEKIVLDLQPAAEFNKTLVAEEFRQSLSCNDVYSEDFTMDNDLVYTAKNTTISD